MDHNASSHDSVPPIGDEPSQQLLELAHAYGIVTQYQGQDGQQTQVSSQTLVAVLGSFDVDATTTQSIETALAQAPLRSWRNVLPPTTVVRAGQSAHIAVHVPHGSAVTLRVECEDQVSSIALRQLDIWVDPRTVDTQLTGRATFEIPDNLALGYHSLVAKTINGEFRALLVVAPQRAPQPSHRMWGIMAQLYSVRSQQSWGVGDFVDLGDLAYLSHESWGADFVLINPVHANEPISPLTPSPYLPTSRRFISPWYIRVEDIRESAYLTPDRRAAVLRWPTAPQSTSPGQRVPHAAHSLTPNQSPNRDELIDRDSAWDAKLAALREVYRIPRSPARQAAFEKFCTQQGSALQNFALWCALYVRFEGRTWPSGYEHPHTDAAKKIAREHHDDIEFFTWLQWIAFEQLGDAQRRAKEAGMRIGVMHDLAVGVHPFGADAWSQRDLIAADVSVGAPPDMYNQMGQDWSQPPWRPDKLEESGYEAFRGMLRTLFAHAGAVRIDHIIGLFRLWWIPRGHGAKDGAYVTYNHEALIGILCLEAHRAGVVVIGEDLGTFEPWVTDYLQQRGLLGTSVLWFESQWDGSPKHADQYRSSVLASVTTHDLPPTAGYLQAEHVRIRAELGLLTVPIKDELAIAERQISAVVGRLVEYGLLKPAHNEESDPSRVSSRPSHIALVQDDSATAYGVSQDNSLDDIVVALHAYLARTPAVLHGVALADMVGERRAQNQPGTDQEYPNWRVPLGDSHGDDITLEQIWSSPLARRIAAAMNGQNM